MKYPKRCQYKHAKQKKYHVRNWAEYNEGLRRRGDLTVWFDEEAIANWKADKTGKPGGQRVYSDMAIETGLVVRMVYKLAYRQTEGFLHSIASLLGLGIEIPDYSTLCRRSRLLRKKLRIPKAASTQPIHLMIDSTGLRIHVGNARKRCLRCLLLVMCTHPFVKKAFTLHLARSEGHERYFGCNLMHRKALASSHQHLMAEAPLTMGCGTMELEAPRVNDKREVEGERQRFTSGILPPYMRRSPKVSEVLPLLYLRGLSTNDFRPALKELLGEDASGLSPTAITRLTGKWQSEYDEFHKRDLSKDTFAYIWIDGIHFNVRLEDDRLCTLVVLGVRADGTKVLLAVEDGYRESEESWAYVLRDLERRGLEVPLLAIGDGALGFWAAARNVWPATRHQLCWVHKLKNVLDKLPKRLHGRAKSALKEIMKAETKQLADVAVKRFDTDFGAKYPKAVASLTKHQDELLTFYDFPAEHWDHIRTTNPIESAFATVRLRQRVTKGAGSRSKALLMAYKLLDMASLRWRRVKAPGLVARLMQGGKFVDGIEENLKRSAA